LKRKFYFVIVLLNKLIVVFSGAVSCCTLYLHCPTLAVKDAVSIRARAFGIRRKFRV